MTTWMITDEHGTAMSDGHDEHTARRLAQDSANRLGRTVYLYAPEDGDDDAEAVEPGGRQ